MAQYPDTCGTCYMDQDGEGDQSEEATAIKRLKEFRQAQQTRTAARELEQLREFAFLNKDETLLPSFNRRNPLEVITGGKKPEAVYNLKCLFRKESPPITTIPMMLAYDSECDTCVGQGQQQAATVTKRIVPIQSGGWTKAEVYDIQMSRPTSQRLNEFHTPTISETNSFKDMQRLLENASVASRDDQESDEDLKKPTWSFEVERSEGLHNIPEATRVNWELKDLGPPTNLLPPSTHAGYDGREVPTDTTAEDPNRLLTLLVRGDYGPRDWDYQNEKWFELEEDLEAKWSFVNSGIINGVNCIVTEPEEIADTLEEYINWVTFLYGAFGTYLSLSTLVVGLTKVDDQRVTLLGLGNVWLFKKYREYMESDPTHNYRNIDSGNIEDIKTVLGIFEPVGSRAKSGKIFMKDTSVMSRRNSIIHSLMLAQLVCITCKAFVSHYFRR